MLQLRAIGQAASLAWYGPPIIANSTGNEEEFIDNFIDESDVSTITNIRHASVNVNNQIILGEGEFGVVKLMRRTTNPNNRPEETKSTSTKQQQHDNLVAVKILRKGYSMRDNILYSPPLPSLLQTEVSILRTLNGTRHALHLQSVYEGNRFLYLITEVCTGGSFMDYREQLLSNHPSEEEDETTSGMVPTGFVKQISFELMDAVDHCAKNGVIHRDIKPGNIMFVKTEGGMSLRLIDFGSGALDDPIALHSEEATAKRHSTFCGSAFYSSPEMFQRTYTYKTDVWSAGVTVYVFVFGFPSGDIMQPIFDCFQSSEDKDRDLKSSLSLVDETFMVEQNYYEDSFWKMLNGCIYFRHKGRWSAGDALRCDFISGHCVDGAATCVNK
mmetsp:Transcript_14169/g.20689  ORF Transcript_14169/g.20689 Transcript_14169/m.20689 type:complete len:385 (+) Transcript_14169:27-1181(+)|eukprot:CAMPEP_0195536160 /NCGR_PEP_ID=MMETSP0794_2-20130614/45575_1 /TAXON_ID=515487 /ORGANISM="Stephanopyxis turris, Strain CCMP 815" /LENGTH=384 /DNA_ID=CAMNT_0040669485 /DNA_START=27 /DNA_END=1181 /DNA_ORIENTATION=+